MDCGCCLFSPSPLVLETLSPSPSLQESQPQQTPGLLCEYSLSLLMPCKQVWPVECPLTPRVGALITGSLVTELMAPVIYTPLERANWGL